MHSTQAHCLGTVESRFKEWPRDWQNMFTIMRFHHIEVLFQILIINYYWGGKYGLLHRGLHYRGSLYQGSFVLSV